MAIDKSKIEMLSNDAKKAQRERRLLNALRKGEDEMRRLSLVGVNNAFNGITGDYGVYDKPFLPMEKHESPEQFVYRALYRTSLYNGTKKSINDINDRIFSQSIKFTCEQDEVFKEHIEYNFDGSGTGLNEFAKMYNKDALWNGCSFILVNQNSGVTNKDNLPNAVLISANDVEILRKDNKGKISAFKHTYTVEEEIDEFETKIATYRDIYFYKNGRPHLTKYKKIEEGEYEIEFDDALSIDEIPIVELYPETERKDLLCNRPYQDMANLNLTNWIFKSTYMTLVDIASRSFIFANGVKENAEKIPYGIFTMFTNSNPSADMKWIQADSKSSDMIKDLLSDNQEEMKMLGSEFLETKATLTATEVKYSTSDTNSRAQNFAFNLEKALEKAVELMFKWHKKESTEFQVEVNKNIGLTKGEEIFDRAVLLNDKNVISDKELRETSKKLGYINADKEEEEYVEDLNNEGKAFGGSNMLNIDRNEPQEDETDTNDNDNEGNVEEE